MKAKTIFFSFTAAVLSAALILILLFIFPFFSVNVRFSASEFAESSDFLSNPHIGFYHLYGFSLTGQDTQKARSLSETMVNDGNRLALLEINLKEFRNRDLSTSSLEELNILLSAFCDCPKSYILRFVYDWSGKAKETEPDDISIILRHMEQISPYVNQNKQNIFVIQGTFAGDCGEMHGSAYTNNEDMITLISKLDSLIDPDIFLSVRTPAHYRTIVRSFEPLSADEAYTRSLRSRLGLFNDGMLGSDFDLGTYGPDSLRGQTAFDAKGTREEELAFQNSLCRYVPNGGECVLDNPYNDFENAVDDFYKMHISYLNCDYDMQVLDKWKNSIYTGESPFQGINGYDYIKSHLGYRYVITNASLQNSRFPKRTAALSITLKNTGFAPAYRLFSSQIFLIPENSDSEPLTFAVAFDNRRLLSQSEQTITVPLDCSRLSAGSYKICFQMRDTSKLYESAISFANKNETTEHGMVIGILTVN